MTILQPYFVLEKWEPRDLWTAIIRLLRFRCGLPKMTIIWQQLLSQGKKTLLQINNLESVIMIHNGYSPLHIFFSLNLLSFKPDLFATQISRQFSNYAGYKPDPEVTFFDAFTKAFSNLTLCAFPPIVVTSKVLFKTK